MPLLTIHKVEARWYIGMPFACYAADPGSIPTSRSNLSNGWNVGMNGTISAPKSVLHYVVDKVKLFVPI